MTSLLQSSEQDYEESCHQIRLYRYERIIFANGCFDVLHPGHVKLLRYCRNLAGPRGAVVVGLNSDESVRRLKGLTRPVMKESDRALMLLSLRFVDHVISFEEDTPLQLLEALRPDVIVKGGDWKPSEVVGNHLSTVAIVPREDGWSTSLIVNGRRS